MSMLSSGHFYIWQDRYGFTVSVLTDHRKRWGATLVESDAPHFPTETEARHWLDRRVDEVNRNVWVAS